MVLIGIALLLATWWDVVRTVFDVGRGAGPLTGPVVRTLWSGVIAGRRRGLSHRAIETFGVGVALAGPAMWLLLAWLGWSLVVASDTDAIIHASRGTPASFVERMYLAGGQMFSLSIGDFRGEGPVWRLVEVAIVASGLLLATLTITYLVPVVENAVERRRVAGWISAYGLTPRALADVGRQGLLEQQLPTLLPELVVLGQTHLAYPVLHVMHSADRRTAIAPSVAALDEALTILIADGTLTGPAVDAVRRAIADFLTTLRLRDGELPPEPPPVVDTADEELTCRRRLLHAAVLDDGWTWSDVTGDDTVERPIAA